MMTELDDLETELKEMEDTVIGDEPSDEYQIGFRDGLQHAISIARGVMDE